MYHLIEEACLVIQYPRSKTCASCLVERMPIPCQTIKNKPKLRKILDKLEIDKPKD